MAPVAKDKNVMMPKTIPYILFEKKFYSATTATTTVTISDYESRVLFLEEMNKLLRQFSKKNEHILPAVIIQLCRLRFSK